MYSEENPQDFRLPVPCLYPCERVMLLLITEASFKLGDSFFESSLLSAFLKGSSFITLPLRTKDVDIPYFVQNFLLALLAYMESVATHLTLTFINF